MNSPHSDMRELPHDQIVRVLGNYRKRTSPEKDAQLAESIKQHGLIQPVCVRPSHDGAYELVLGQRRFRANQASGNTTILAVVRSLSDEQVRLTQLVENGQREDAHPIEEAEAFKELHEQLGLSVDQIADRVGKAAAHVRRRLKLCDLDEQVRQAFYEDKLTLEAAYPLAGLPNPDDQRKALEYILEHQRHGDVMSARDVRAYIEHTFLLRLQDAPFDTKDATLVPEAGPCGSCPKHTGNQRDLFGELARGAKPMCTDASCFKKKLEASYTRKAEQALTRGHDVLSPEESAALFPHGWRLAPNSPYLDIDDRHPTDPEQRTYRELLRTQKLPQVLAVDSYHQTHDLVLKVDAETALTSAGYEFINAAQRLKQERTDARKRKAEAREQRNNLLAAIVQQVEQQPPDAEFWRILVLGLVQGSWHETISEVVKRRGLHVKGKQPEEVLSEHIARASDHQLRAVALELVISRGSNALYTSSPLMLATKKYASEMAEPLPAEVLAEGKAPNLASKHSNEGDLDQQATAEPASAVPEETPDEASESHQAALQVA